MAFRTSKLKTIPDWARPASGAFFCWLIGTSVFLTYGRLGIFSLGYDDLATSLSVGFIGWLPVVLLIGKLFATVFSYGSGGCGGIFAPSLFFGAMTGCVVETVFIALGFPLTVDDRMLLTIIGMSSCLGAVVRAPCTSILIVFEMTREFSLVPSLLVAGIISQALCRWLQPEGFYEQVLKDDGHLLNTVMPPRDFREWQHYPVSAIANFQPIVLKSLDKDSVKPALDQYHYSHFIHQQGVLPPEIVLRGEAVNALAGGVAIPVHLAPTCLRTDSIETVERQLVDSVHGIILILDGEKGRVVGLVTLHDLLRAQESFTTELGE